MGLYNFKRFIAKYSREAVFVYNQTGHYDKQKGGVYVIDSTVKKEIKLAAVVPLSGKDLKFEENGRYTSDDRKLYCYKKIEVGTKVEHKKLVYTVDKEKDYADFDDDLHIYFLTRSGHDNRRYQK